MTRSNNQQQSAVFCALRAVRHNRPHSRHVHFGRQGVPIPMSPLPAGLGADADQAEARIPMN
jgi:hypothetical protein